MPKGVSLFPTSATARMFKRNVKTESKLVKVEEPFDEAGEIQIVPIDTIIDDGGYDLEVDDLGGNQVQGCRAHGKLGLYSRFSTTLFMLNRNPIPVKVPKTPAYLYGGNQISWLSFNHVGHHCNHVP